MEHSTVQSRFKAARAAKGLTQDQVARTAEIRTMTLSEIECGKTKCPSWQTAEAVATALDVSPFWLVFGYDRGPKVSRRISKKRTDERAA